MKYICYLSKQRVDSLFETAFDGIVDETVKKSSRSATGTAEVGVNSLIAWIKGGLKFGGKVSSETETKRRATAVSRLNAVLAELSASDAVASLAEVIRSHGKLEADWFEIHSRLRVPSWNPRDAAVDLVGDVEGYALHLSCGKENFSGLYREGDVLIPTSTNRYLFEGKIALPMSGLVKLVDADRRKKLLRGTALYLVLNPLDEDLGAYNDVEI